MYLPVIIIIVVLIVSLYIFINMPKSIPKSKFTIVAPQYVYGVLSEKDANVLLVNVLSDKMPYKITLNGVNDKRSLSKAEFEHYLKDNNNVIGVDNVVLYCAGWSCGAAKNYYNDLAARNIDVTKVLDYEGSIHEWASYSKIRPSIFTFNSIESKSPIDASQLLKDTSHKYYVENYDNAAKELSMKYLNFADNLM